MEMLLASRWLSAVPPFLTARRPGIAAPTIGFVATASEIYPEPGWVDYDRETLRGFGYRLDEVDLSRTATADIATQLDAVDAVFVSGGNTFHLLHVLRSTGTDELLAARIRDGLPYIGVSAGALIVGPDIAPVTGMDDPSETEPLASTAGLGLIGEIVMPHADGIVVGRAAIDAIRRRHAGDDRLVFIDDDQALVVSGSERTVVSS